MAHADQMRFFGMVADAFPGHFEGRVLDVGALDVNGGPHNQISPSEYVGVDLAEGPNITLVARGEDLQFPTGHFDVAMSSECFEHNPAWQSTLHNMIRMTRPSGLIVFSCATTGRPEHGTSRSDGGFGAPLAVELGQEYYRNVSAGVVRRVVDDGKLAGYFTVVNDRIFDLYFVGIKGDGRPADLGALKACWSRVRTAYEPARSYGSIASFLNNRSRRYIARGVGDSTLEAVRRTRDRHSSG